MVQRNKGLNFSIRYKGGGNFTDARNPVENNHNLIEPAGAPLVFYDGFRFAFDPSDSDNVVTTGVIITGSVVGTLLEQWTSSYGDIPVVLTQSVTGRKPLLVQENNNSNLFNGHSYVLTRSGSHSDIGIRAEDFDIGNSNIVASSSQAGGVNYSGYTLIVVGAPGATDGNAGHQLVRMWDNHTSSLVAGTTGSLNVGHTSTPSPVGNTRLNNSQANPLAFSPVVTGTVDRAEIYVGITDFDDKHLGANGVSYFYFSGLVLSGANSSGAPAGKRFLEINVGSSDYFSGQRQAKVAWVEFYTRRLTDEELTAKTAYLAARFGVTMRA